MKRLQPQQPTFDEAQALADDPALQKLLQWYPGQQDRILAAYRRRNPHPGCTCPWQRRKAGRCCVRDRLPPPPTTDRRRRAPSAAGQYGKHL